MMGSIKLSQSGREKHWTDSLRKYVPPNRLPRNFKRQVKSSPGQLRLFEDTDIRPEVEVKKK